MQCNILAQLRTTVETTVIDN